MNLDWRARVEGEGEVGGGIVVDEHNVLTCAHVVHGLRRAQVVIAGEVFTADVDERASWRQTGDVGDVAVLRLTRPTAVPPARFAALDSLRTGSSQLVALGFPYADGSSETVGLTSKPGMGLDKEWWQINVEAAHLQTIREGFSGAGVYRLDTNEVVGMVSEANMWLEGTSGRMIPTAGLRRYWPDLDDHLPFTWLTPLSRRELRALLHEIGARPAPRKVMRTAFPYIKYKPGSHWDAICYLGEEVNLSVERQSVRDVMFAHYLDSLASLLRRDAKRELDAWFRKWMPDHARSGARTSQSASILVRVERFKEDPPTLTVEALVDGQSLLDKRSVPVQLDEADIQAKTESLVPEVCQEVQHLDPIIEFALPDTLLNLPCETWTYSKEEGTALDAFSVVVRDVTRLQPGSQRRPFAARRWKALRATGATRPVEIPCGSSYHPRQYRSLLRPHDEVGIVAYSRSPARELLLPALSEGIPVMMWSRSPCPSPGHGECERALRQLVKRVRGVHPDDYPQRVRELRDSAWHPLRWKRNQCGRDLTLFWDDPDRLPDPPLHDGTL